MIAYKKEMNFSIKPYKMWKAFAYKFAEQIALLMLRTVNGFLISQGS